MIERMCIHIYQTRTRNYQVLCTRSFYSTFFNPFMYLQVSSDEICGL
jgi:hypothetical protein